MNFPSYSQSEFSHGVAPQSRDQNPPPTQSSSTLDQLWERFCSRWHLEDSQPTSNGEASLLERLERLSRLIHDTRESKAPGSSRGSEDGAQRRQEGKEDEAAETQRRFREARKAEAESPSSGRDRWVEHPSEHQHLCPADRDETDTVSTSGSISTVDTARLVRAFGSHRVQLLKTSCSLRKLYSTIDKQKERREQRGGASEEQLAITAASRLTQDSTVSEFRLGKMAPQPRGVGGDLMGKEQEVRFKRLPQTPDKPTWSESAHAAPEATRHHQCP